MLSGCLGDDDGDREPEEVIDTLWEAWDSGDSDQYLAQFHEDSPMRDELEQEVDEHLGDTPAQEAEWSIESRETIEETEDEVIIEEVYIMDFPDEGPWQLTDHYTLRRSNGEWLIWSFENVDFEMVDE